MPLGLDWLAPRTSLVAGEEWGQGGEPRTTSSAGARALCDVLPASAYHVQLLLQPKPAAQRLLSKAITTILMIICQK